MATFSTNQVRQLYVAKELIASNVALTDNVGAIAVKNDTQKSHLYFEYMGSGGITRSDLINTANIVSGKATDGDALAYNLNKYKLTLSSAVNSGAPVAGQDYILRIAFRNYIGLSEEDQYFKYGMYHAVTGTTASTLYKELILSLVKNFSKDEQGLLKFYLETGGTSPSVVAGTPAEVTTSTVASTLTGTYTGIVIEEAPQFWSLGVFPQVPVNFSLQPMTVISNGDELIWGTVNKVTSTSVIKDGKSIADIEYFCMGERGDMYRKMGFPNSINTAYLVDPSLAYNVIDLTYNYSGLNEDVQKSQKVITIAIPKIGANNATSNVLTNSIITAINTATGLSIATLSVSE